MEYRSLLGDILAKIVDKPSKVEISKKEDERGILLIVNIDEDDAPMVIGTKGQTIQSIRNIFYAIGGNKENSKISIKLDIPQK